MIYLCLPRVLYLLGLYGVNGVEKVPMRIDTKKTLTQREKARQKRDRIGNDVM
jgi:hypothetical protein